jgi:predicted Zn-dependent peptidase
MRVRAPAAAATLIASLLFIAPCAAVASTQVQGALPRGGSYVLDSDPTIAAAAVGLWFRAPGAGYDNGTPGISRIAATAAAAAPLASGKSLVELVHSVGGELSISVYPDIVGIGAVVPSEAAKRVVAAMTAAYFAPTIDDAAVNKAQRDAAVHAVEERYSSDLTLHDLLFAQIFADGPAHYPPLPDSVAALAHIQLASVSAFAKRAFRSSNAVLTLSGNVDSSSIQDVTDGDGKTATDAPFDSTLDRSPAPSTTAQGKVSGLGIAWVGPPIADERAATALDLVADYLFCDETGVVSKALEKSASYADGQFITLHDPGIMLVTIGGDDAKAAKDRVLAEIAKLEVPLDPQTFAAAREAFLYHIASDTQTPPQQADNLGWYAVEGGASYAPGASDGAYERAARDLDPQYVAGIVRRYLRSPVTVNLITAPPARESAS